MPLNYDVLILDLDGTVYLDGKPIRNIVNQLNSFVEDKGEVFYLSNNTSVSRYDYLHKLNKLGLKTTIDQIISPSIVAGEHLTKNVGSKGYIVGTEALIEELSNAYGIVHNYDESNFVLIGFDKEVTYEKLQRACELINGGVPYYVTHVDLACPSELGPIPDCGSIATLIKAVTQKDFKDHFGKPSLLMANYLHKVIHNIDQKRCLFAGDRLYTDIALGNLMKIDTLLVFSGATTKENYQSRPNNKPAFVADTLSEFLDSL